MSDLKFLFPDIPVKATTIQSVTAFNSSDPLLNIVSGGRQSLARASTKTTSLVIDYDLGSGVSKPIDFLVLSRADILIKNDTGTPNLKLKGNTSFSYIGSTTILDESIIQGDLVGRLNEDIVFEFSEVSYRSFFIELTTSIQVYQELGKITFGKSFDIGRNPTEYEVVKITNYNGRLSRTFNFKFQGLTSVDKQAFTEKIVNYKESIPFFIYDEDNVFFTGAKLINVKIVSISYQQDKRENWSINMQLEELI